MTEKFNEYLHRKESKYSNPFDIFFYEVAPVMDEVLGPMTTDELWKLFSSNKNITRMDRLSINMRDTLGHLYLSLAEIILTDGGLSRGDEIFRTIQSASKKELYPGSIEDLGVVKQKE